MPHLLSYRDDRLPIGLQNTGPDWLPARACLRLGTNKTAKTNLLARERTVIYYMVWGGVLIMPSDCLHAGVTPHIFLVDLKYYAVARTGPDLALREVP